MARNELISVKDVIHKLQLCLLDDIKDESQLFAAGSLMSQSDYQDVVTERSIADMCGYSLCSNRLPSERPRKGRYHISLKEHKVYDLHETYMYCSTKCVVDSRAFAGSLQEERCSVLNSGKLNEVMRLFEGLGLNEEDVGRGGDFGLSKLKIQENSGSVNGGVSMEEWVGPSNAIEGYVPQRDRSSKSLHSKNRKQGSKPSQPKPNKGETVIFNDMDFMSTIITQDEYTVSKIPMEQKKTVSNTKSKASKNKVNHKEVKDMCSTLGTSTTPAQTGSTAKSYELNEGDNSRSLVIAELSISELSLDPCQRVDKKNAMVSEKEFLVGESAETSSNMLKSSLKSCDAMRATRSVTWADEKNDSAGNRNLCEFSESKDKNEAILELGKTDMRDADNAFRHASAEACAIALSQAAEAVAAGESDGPDAVSEAGITVLAPPNDADEVCSQESVDDVDPEPAPLKWPRKTGISESDFFDSEDSWFDSPPEGSLTLSSFATMYMALFSWTSSSTLAYIYGRDDSFHEDYAPINGREYPRKIVLTDGRSSEIKQTLAGCLARALPGLVADLGLPTPISTIENGMGCLLETMSFLDPLPPFRMKQWQVVVLLLIGALSVSRIPALTPHMTDRRRLFQKVFDGAQVSAEEYEVMNDLVIPVGRVPQLSTQSGAVMSDLCKVVAISV